MAFADHFSRQAADYTRYRPNYPASLFDYLAGQCRERTQCLDVATGNGQAALSLGDYFAQVIACEPSLAQLTNAEHHTRVHYVCSTAEQLPFQDEQFDLISVAQAAHWFDHSRFNSEARRLLRSGGLLALWCYGLFSIEPAIDQVINHYYSTTLNGYWPPERHWIEQGYRDLPFPFTVIETPDFKIEAYWTLPQVLGYITTWSATQRYLAEHDGNPLVELNRRLAEHWQDPAERKPIHWPVYLIAGHKP